MKASLILIPFVLLLTGCATIKQNIDARANLAKCQYEFAGIDLKSLKFGSGAEVDSLFFDVKIKVTNKADSDVAIDHVNTDYFLDQNHILGLDHNVFTRIPAAQAKVDSLTVELPFKGILNQIGKKPENITVKAKLWLTLLVGKDTWETPVVFALDITVPIPYDKIRELVEAEKKKLENEAKARAEAEARKAAEEAKAKASEEAKKVKDSIKSLF